jgi:Uma2 family endonuclease
MAVNLRRRRFTVDDYYAMADAGIFRPDERVELIEGEIIDMGAIGSLHAAIVTRLSRMLVLGVGEQAIVRVQDPVRLSDLTEPEPDLALLRPRDDFYAAGHPLPPDTLLVVEVSHTTLGYDRGIKLPLYATAGIPEVWIVNPEDVVVEVYREPARGRYRSEEHIGIDGVLRCLAIPSLEIPVSRVLS